MYSCSAIPPQKQPGRRIASSWRPPKRPNQDQQPLPLVMSMKSTWVVRTTKRMQVDCSMILMPSSRKFLSAWAVDGINVNGLTEDLSRQPLTESMMIFDSVRNYDLTVDIHRPVTSSADHAGVAFNCLLLFVGQPDIALIVVEIVSIDASLLILCQLRKRGVAVTSKKTAMKQTNSRTQALTISIEWNLNNKFDIEQQRNL